MLDELPMTALVDARAMLPDNAHGGASVDGAQDGRESTTRVQLRLLLPPYPALGCGVLRALRVREVAGCLELVAGYDAYERLGP